MKSIDLNNLESSDYNGKVFYEDKIINCVLKINNKFIRFLSKIEEKSNNLVTIIPYKNIVFFAINNKNDQNCSEFESKIK